VKKKQLLLGDYNMLMSYSKHRFVDFNGARYKAVLEDGVDEDGVPNQCYVIRIPFGHHQPR
jgi:hypothetical protein